MKIISHSVLYAMCARYYESFVRGYFSLNACWFIAAAAPNEKRGYRRVQDKKKKKKQFCAAPVRNEIQFIWRKKIPPQ